MIEDTKRIEKLVFFLNMDQKEFYLSIPDVDNKSWSKFEHKNQISKDLANKIIEIYPKVSLKWLLLNEGYITNNPSQIDMQKGVYFLTLSTNKLTASTNKLIASTNKHTRIISTWVQVCGWLSVIASIILLISALI